jgi:hypothetical protein
MKDDFTHSANEQLKIKVNTYLTRFLIQLFLKIVFLVIGFSQIKKVT